MSPPRARNSSRRRKTSAGARRTARTSSRPAGSLPATLRVYPVNNYGAIATGTHEFFAVKAGEPDRLTETGQFTIVWKEEDGRWKLARALSFDHVLAQ